MRDWRIFVSEAKSKCRYCRIVENHHVDCPKDDPTAILFWGTGHRAATAGHPNPHPDEPLVTMGYEAGKLELERLNASEQQPSTPPEELFPEHAPDDRPSRAPVSVSEFSLLVGEILEPSPIAPTDEDEKAHEDDKDIPPVLQARRVYAREITARDADLY